MTAARPMTVDELCAWIESDDGPRATDRPAIRSALSQRVRAALTDGDAARAEVSAHNAKVKAWVDKAMVKVDAALAARKAGQR